MSKSDAEPDPRPTLEYGTAPTSPRPTRIFAAVCGFGVALVALLAWPIGAYCVVHAMLYANHRDRPGDLIGASIFIIMGVVCAYWARRWLRDAFRTASDDGDAPVVVRRRRE